MPKKEIYCGIKKCPKNKRVGTMKECAEAKQVRRYGVYKIDTRVLQASNESKNIEADRKAILTNIMSLRGKISNITKNIVYEKDPKKKKLLNDQLKEHKIQLQKLNQEFQKIEKLRKN